MCVLAFIFTGVFGGLAIIILGPIIIYRLTNGLVFLIFKKYVFPNADKMQYKDFNARSYFIKNRFRGNKNFDNLLSSLNSDEADEAFENYIKQIDREGEHGKNEEDKCLNNKEMQEVFKKFKFSESKIKELIKILFILEEGFVAQKVGEDPELMEYYLKSVESGDPQAVQLHKLEKKLGIHQ